MIRPVRGFEFTGLCSSKPSNDEAAVMMSRCLLIPLLIGCGSLLARAQLVEQYSFNPNLAIPDGNSTGASDSQLITSSAIPAIAAVTVALNATGDFNGDLYVYLRHET